MSRLGSNIEIAQFSHKSLGNTQSWLKFNSNSYILAFIYGLGILQTYFGFNQPIFNTIFVLALILSVVILPVKDGIKLLPMVLVYFGYSYVEMHILGGVIVYNSTLTNIYLLLLAVKTIIFHTSIVTSGKYILMTILGSYIFAQRLCNYLITDGIIGLLSIVIIIFYLERVRAEDKELEAFITLFVIAIASSYIYNFLHIDLIAIYEAKEPWREAWRNYQFVGMRDPNNVALQANFCLSYILIRDLFKNKLVKFLMVSFLVVTSIITISASGIITTIIILFLKYFEQIRKHYFIWFIILLVMFGILLNWQDISNIMRSSDKATIRSVSERMDKLTLYYRLGNYYQLTSSRTWLWQRYMAKYNEQSFVKQLFGNPFIKLESIDPASHNGWIDFLLDNGIFGLLIFLFTAFGTLIRRKELEGTTSIIIVVLFAANIYMRSLGNLMIYILLF